MRGGWAGLALLAGGCPDPLFECDLVCDEPGGPLVRDTVEVVAPSFDEATALCTDQYAGDTEPCAAGGKVTVCSCFEP